MAVIAQALEEWGFLGITAAESLQDNVGLHRRYTLHSTSLYSGGNPYSKGDEKTRDLRRRSLNFLARAIDAKLLQPTTCARLFELAQTVQ